MYENYTERVQKIIRIGRQEAQRLNSEFLGTEHFLLGIIQEGGSVAAKVLKNMNVDLKRVRQEIEKLITPSTSPTVTLGQLPLSPRAKHALELAHEAACQLGSDVIGSEHLLLGVLKENEGIAAQVLTNLGLRLDEVRDMVLEVLGADVAPEKPKGPEKPKEPAWPWLRVEIEKDNILIINTREIVSVKKNGQMIAFDMTTGKDFVIEGGEWVNEAWKKLEQLLTVKP